MTQTHIELLLVMIFVLIGIMAVTVYFFLNHPIHNPRNRDNRIFSISSVICPPAYVVLIGYMYQYPVQLTGDVTHYIDVIPILYLIISILSPMVRYWLLEHTRIHTSGMRTGKRQKDDSCPDSHIPLWMRMEHLAVVRDDNIALWTCAFNIAYGFGLFIYYAIFWS